ncbi:MAG: hypothetical protein ACD_65C00105G0001 [uncultured bacterium]|nr:MAG: hypothetical protein ACD_65C00105G0001 [uncultured bacterium]KKT02388.1 MAG: polymerase III subunit delta, DNA polymerase III subunit delta protein [Candidatus Peregrinibacteria bacterium GW2011_GWF2_43_17]HAU39470.1 DNA polymerase III subunit delta [Candidatus Peregrinibacteria bacterium]
MSQSLGNLIFMYGEDTYSIYEKINLWKSEFVKRYGSDINLAEIEGEKAIANNVTDAITAMPFLAEKRLVIIKNFILDAKNEEQKKLVEKLKEVPDTTVLVFYETASPDKRVSLFKYLSKTAKVYTFEELSGQTLNKWILEKTEKEGGKIGIMSASYLAEFIGPDLWKLSNEIKKLVAFANGKEIQSRDIDAIVVPSSETSIFKFTDQLGSSRIQSAIETLHALVESGEELPYIFAMIIRQFRLLIQVKDLLRKGFQRQQIIDRMKIAPFVASNLMSQARNFEPDQLKKMHRRLLEMDERIKTSKIYFSTTDKKHYLMHLEKLIIG